MHGSQPSAHRHFNSFDKRLAAAAIIMYEDEILGADRHPSFISGGLRAEFDCLPSEEGVVLDRIDDHIAHYGELIDRVQTFGQFVATISTFVGRPAGSLIVTQQAVATYVEIFNALSNYVTVLRAHGRSPQAQTAALLVSCMINPQQWRGVNPRVPEGMRSYREYYDNYTYLQVVAQM